MLVAYRLAGLSTLEGHYAGLNARMQFGATQRPSNVLMPHWRTGAPPFLINFGRTPRGRVGGVPQVRGMGSRRDTSRLRPYTADDTA